MRKFFRSVMGTTALLAFAACARTEDVLKDAYTPFVGLTITDFITRTGQEPKSSFDNENGQRVFLIGHPFVNKTCRVIITVPEDKTYRIVGIRSFCP